ncbi:MAG: hypothetical protein ABI448_16330 [Bacteroidia bacterium]
MISKSEVVDNLTRLEQLFDNSLLKPTTYHEANYFGKLAVMEASAWLEECVENIYEELASLHLTVEANKKSYKTIIKKIMGLIMMNI